MQEIDELIERFKAADDRNYTLLAYVNELNQEVAKLEEQVRAIEREMESAQAAALSRAGARARAQHEVRSLLLKRFIYLGETEAHCAHV